MKIPFFKKSSSSFVGMWGVALLAMSGVSCDTYTGTGALIGAAAGAAIGNNNSDRSHYHRGRYGRGHYHGGRDKTLPGALIGAAVGGLVGVAADAARNRRYGYRGDRYNQPYQDNRYNNNGYGDDYRYLREGRSESSNSYPSQGQYDSTPYARASNRDGVAVSPHPPFGEVDVSGLRSGQKALDPTSGKAFRVP